MGIFRKFSFGNINLKTWHGVLVVAFVLTLSLGLGISRYALAWSSVANPALQTTPPVGDSALRVGSTAEGAAAVDTKLTTDGGFLVPNSSNPTGAPGNGSQPVPSFSGLNIKGPIVNSAGPISIFDDTILYGLTDARSGLVNSSAPGGVATPLTIYDNLKVAAVNPTEPGDIIVDGSVKNSNATALVLDSDGIYTAGDSILGGKLSVSGAVRNLVNGAPFLIDDTLSVTGNASVSGTLDVKGTIFNSATTGGLAVLPAPVSINDNLAVAGNATVNGTLTVATNATVSGNLTIIGSSTINSLSVGGFISNPNAGGVPWGSDGPVVVQDGFYVSGKTILNGLLTVDDSLVLTGTISDSDGSVNIMDGLNVTGASLFLGSIRATNGFGTYSRVPSVITVAAGAVTSVTATCPAGATLISCTPTTASDGNFSAGAWTSYVQIMSLYPDLDAKRCTMWAKNTAAASEKYFGVYAICLNPNQ